MNDLVSVVTPAYNAASYIEETIASVRSQRHRPLEHIVVDDCSPDGLGDLVEGLASADTGDGYHLELVRHTVNQGTAAALETGISAASGDYIAWLSADDLYIEPDKTGDQLRLLRADPEAAMVSDWSTLTGPHPSTAEIQRSRWPALVARDRGLRGGEPDATALALLWSNPINGTSVLMRRSALNSVAGFDPAVGAYDQDGDLWLRMSGMKQRFLRREAAGTFYRIHPGQLSTNKAEHAFRKAIVRIRFLQMLKGSGELGDFLDSQAGLLARLATHTPLHRGQPLVTAALLELDPAVSRRAAKQALRLMGLQLRGCDLRRLPEAMDTATSLGDTLQARTFGDYYAKAIQ